MMTRLFMARCLTALALLALPLTAAEVRPKAGDRPARAEQAGPRGRNMGFARILTEEQREQVRLMMQEQREELRKLDERVQRLQREIEEEVFAGQLNEDAVREKARALAQAQAERTVFRARVIARIRPTLTGEQLEQLKQVWGAASRPIRPNRRPEQPGRPPLEREGEDLPPPRRATPAEKI
jgi:Spy/CpxP family protein refolding chaperone